MKPQTITHFHLFCGLGGAARGGRHLAISTHAGGRELQARFVCIGGVDVDRGAVDAFSRYAGVRGTAIDLFSREQFEAFHGRVPKPPWRQAEAEDLRRAAGGKHPDIIVTSPPCKGFSGLVSESRASSHRYAALNALTVRGIELAIRAWADNPPAFWLLENVPRLVNRGAHLLGEIVQLLTDAGYGVTYTIPDLGEIGNLAQSRKRLHLVARHLEKVPVHVFEPPKRRLRAVAEVLGPLPLPGDPAAGPLHALPMLEWRTWVRLALIRAGGDWRDLQELPVVDGYLRDLALVPVASWHKGGLGVLPWGRPAGTMTSEGLPHNGRFSVADPRPPYTGEYGQLGVQDWEKPGATVTGQRSAGQGPLSVADPRLPWNRQPGDDYAKGRHYGVQPWSEPSSAVTAAGRHDNGPWSVADPRCATSWAGKGKYRVTGWQEAGGVVIAESSTGNGAFVIADPRLPGVHHNNVFRVVRFTDPSTAITAGQGPTSGGVALADPRFGWHPGASTSKMRVAEWDEPARTITGSDRPGSGAAAVADPREWPTSGPPSGPPVDHLPQLNARGVWIIQALDGTWHRPMSVLERAALQGLLDHDTIADFTNAVAGVPASRVSEWVGNAIPPPAMEATLRAAGLAILLSRAGETFALGSTPVWVRPLARGLLAGAIVIP